jgi:hypothetical protein
MTCSLRLVINATDGNINTNHNTTNNSNNNEIEATIDQQLLTVHHQLLVAVGVDQMTRHMVVR